ncbi:hypothetical protein VNO78_04397 [Psophocarpus tetragonolobus]|uniref:Uncharacterized protein n=1 Tax=Psophocarpus tetragonolobus TaxID=3891 RepID=A0AAN9T301_PSOTE
MLTKITASDSYIILAWSTYKGTTYLPLILLDNWLVLGVDNKSTRAMLGIYQGNRLPTRQNWRMLDDILFVGLAVIEQAVNSALFSPSQLFDFMLKHAKCECGMESSEFDIVEQCPEVEDDEKEQYQYRHSRQLWHSIRHESKSINGVEDADLEIRTSPPPFMLF